MNRLWPVRSWLRIARWPNTAGRCVYVTITPEYRLEVSPRLKEDYRNGRSYYPHTGSQCPFPPQRLTRQASIFCDGITNACIALCSRPRFAGRSPAFGVNGRVRCRDRGARKQRPYGRFPDEKYRVVSQRSATLIQPLRPRRRSPVLSSPQSQSIRRPRGRAPATPCCHLR